MNNTACIPDDRLKLLVLGELPEPDAAPLEQHLLACATCVERTRSLRLDDTLVTALHQAGGGQLADDQSAAIELLVQRLSGLATHSSLLDETQAPTAKPSRGVADLVSRLEPAAAPDELGRLGGFRLLKLLGQGGMGAVFLAEDIELRRRVALKLLRPEQLAQSGAVERFLREARAAAAIRHDHVVTIYQVGQAQGMPFIAQELLEGETLEERLKREGSVPIGDALRIGREIASGLAAAHAQGLLHRDVKPGNVWLEGRNQGSSARVQEPDTSHQPPATSHSDARTKLLDFGLARSQQGDEQLTQSGAIVGTPAYMSPEQAQGRELDARSDLFSLGGVLYRMLTGRLPFPGTNVLSILRSLAVDEPPAARSLNNEVPAELSALIADLLQKDRDKRPASAATVATRLAQIESTWGRPLACPAKQPALKVRWLVAAGIAVAALIAFGIFLTIKTPHGEIAVELGNGVEPNEVRIKVERNGDVKIVDAKNNWTIDVKEGQYSVQLNGGNDKLDINQRSVTVSRKKKTVVTVTLKPTRVVVNPAKVPEGDSLLAGLDLSSELDGIPAHVKLFSIVPSDPITVEVYASLQANTGKKRDGICTPLFTSGRGLEIKRDNFGNRLFWQAWDRDKADDDRVFTPDTSLNKRIHLAAVSTGRELRLYLDGKLCEKRPIEVQLSNREAPAMFGAPWNDRNPLNATIYDARISEGARYDHDFAPPVRFESDERTLALYCCDEGEGDVLTDSSGRGNHGKIVNAKWVPGIAGGPSVDPNSPIPNPKSPPPLAIAPFKATEATAHQQAWADYLGVPVEYRNSVGMEFVLVPPGEFMMGQSAAEAAAVAALHPKDAAWKRAAEGASPAHRVRLSQPFYLGKHEVTQRQYQEVTGKNPAHFSAGGAGKTAVAGVNTNDFPVDSIDFTAAAAFCDQLTRQEKLAPDLAYRLPSEAQWEFACRAGTSSTWPTGDAQSSLQPAAWYAANSGGKPHPVGGRAANPLGLYDLTGNVWEWCQDWHDPGEYARRGAELSIDPAGPPRGTARVLRGGSWGSEPADLRSATRATPFSNRATGYGLRVLLPVAGMRKLLHQNSQSPPLAVIPFTIAEAKDHQAVWAKHLGVPVEYSNSIGMKFVLVPPGEFTMGSSEADIEEALTAVHPSDKLWRSYIAREAPQHRVVLSQPIYLGVHEVTQGQYAAVLGNHPSYFAATGVDPKFVAAVAGLDTSRFPVEGIRWNDCQALCDELNKREKCPGGYGLPTEAQWEFACRAGSPGKYCTGNGNTGLLAVAWFDANSQKRPHPVGQLSPNAFGLYDLHGNVWEWVQDTWTPEFYAQTSGGAVNPLDTSAADGLRVLRGGDWSYVATACRSSARRAEVASNRNAYLGVRLALSVETVKATLAKRPLASSPPPLAGSELLARQMADMPPPEIVGDWQIDDGWLILAGENRPVYGSLRFGDPAWEDYDLKARVILGAVWPAEFGLIGRGDGYNRCEYILLGFANPTNRDLLVFAAGQDGWRAPTRRFLSNQSRIQPGSTHWVELRMRGSQFTTFFDGVQVSTTEESRLRRGRAGFSSWAGTRFRDIEVRAPGGALLWSGLPPVKQLERSAEPVSGEPARARAPFTAEQARACQQQWAEHLKAPIEYENSLGMKLRLIPPGEFLMGSSPEEVAELLAAWDPNDKRGPECIRSGSPQHRVILTRPIYAGSLEVTQQQYLELMGDNPAAFAKEGEQRAVLDAAAIADTASFPVESVSWYDAIAFCQKLTMREKIDLGGGYRLPTEAEWEFACRAGTTSQYHSGDGEAAAFAAGWFGPNSGGRTHPAGELAATSNAFGLFDMHGNVWEWSLDRYDFGEYARRTTPTAVDPQNLTSPTTERVLRGGNWRCIPQIGRAAIREGRDEFHRHHDYGFRVWLPVDSLLASAAKNGKPIGEVPSKTGGSQQP